MKCSESELHLWRIDLDGEARSNALLSATLSQDERRRAERLRTLQLRERWTTAHGALRWILAEYVSRPPETLVFEHGLHGKPELLGDARSNIRFNLTHSAGLALVGITSGRRVGVDAEIVRPKIELEDLSRRFFSAEESAEILALPEGKRPAAFYRCWSRKEALIKATGDGLSVKLSRFRVSVLDDEPARLLSSEDDFMGKWALLDLSEAGFAAAAAIEGNQPLLKRIEFTAPK